MRNFISDPECQRRIHRGGWAEDEARGSCNVPIGPRNAYSNVGYAGWGFYLLVTSRSTLQTAMGVAMIMLAFGSWWYHSEKTIAGNNADWVGMYACAAVILGGAIGVHTYEILIPIGMIFVVLFAWAINRVRFDAFMGVTFLVGAISAIARHGVSWMIVIATLCFALAYLAWQLDKRRNPIVGLWGHALWHLLTAPGLALLHLAQ